jgi:hypothetical protein
MSTAASSTTDQALSDLLASAAPATIPEVIALMQAIDAVLPVTDGLKWFNRIYLSVTQQVDLNPPGGAWLDPAWLDRLDVVFAGFYFNALRNFLAAQPIPDAWTALFSARFQPGIDRIQFALAGMNAHINHDLALALLATSSDLNILPAPDGPQHQDYEAVNSILQSLIPTELTLLASDTLGVLAQDTGKIGRLLAFWNICAARDLAWDFCDHLRSLPTPLRDTALDAQDGLTGALGRALLAVP